MLLHHDHVDLIVTAALTWRVLIGPPAAALSMPGSLASLDGSRAGTLILEQNHAAASTAEPLKPYVFTPVEEPLVPVEILKACHAASHACRGSHGWETSVAQTLLIQTAWAAAVRMPGYSAAPWSWRRHRNREAVLAIAHGWTPAPLDVDWVDVTQITATAWQQAGLVLVAGDALSEVAERLARGDLPARPNVFAITTGDHVAAAAWNGDVDHILHWPECTQWLTDHLTAVKVGGVG